MTFGFFVTLFILTVLLGFVSIFLVVKRKRYGKKPLIITVTAFAILLAIVIPLGNKPLTGDFRKEASVFTYDKYLSDDVPTGTIVKVSGQVVTEAGFIVAKGEIFKLNGVGGSFYVKNNNVENIKLKDGEVVTIYGGYAGVGENLPSINAQIIEK
jgi:hypothetical protein